MYISSAARSSCLPIIASSLVEISLRRSEWPRASMPMVPRLTLLYYCVITLLTDIFTWVIITFEMVTYICIVGIVGSIDLLGVHLAEWIKRFCALSMRRIGVINTMLNS